MRITMKSIHQNILGNLNSLTSELNRVNNQISSGKQMSKISDDPVNLITALGLRTNLAELSQYKENLNFGTKVINASDNALTQIKDMIMRSKTLALQQINAPITAANRLTAAEEVRHLFEQTIILGNSEVNGKYIFGGQRTTGYTAAEPTPFVADLIDGYRANGATLAPLNQYLTGTIDNTPPADLVANDLLINGADVGPVTLNVATVNGLNMGGAVNLAAAINGAGATPPVTAALTTLYAGAAATPEGGNGGETMTQSINGVNFSVVVPDSATANDVATLTAAAINAIADQTGVKARVGDGANGGAIDSVVLYNAQPGNQADIVVGPLVSVNADTGLAAGTYSVGAANNTGEVSLTSTQSFTVTTSAADDTILNRIGLGGGAKGFADVNNDGQLLYGPRIGAGALRINGVAIGASASDNLSTVYADVSAAAKAKAINDLAATTGVSASITPAYRQSLDAVIAGTMRSGDLIINGVDIFDGSGATNPDPATIIAQDTDNTLLTAINAKTGATGVVATRDTDGRMLLSAIDGRNLQIATSVNGENITRINGAAANAPANMVYLGTVHLHSDRQFTVETTPTGTIPIYEPGLAALGLNGGAAVTGESKDVANDGKLAVVSIVKREGSVRYTGDRQQQLSVKVGQSSTLAVSKNGQIALADTGVFTILKNFENALRGQKYTTVTGIKQASDITAKLNSGNTGLERNDLAVTNGAMTFTVADHNYYPPRERNMLIPVDAAEDSPVSIAGKINGIPGLAASWSADGQLTISATDASRYTFSFTDSSNFLGLSGINTEQMQLQALDVSISSLEKLMDDLANQISDFGARANRIDVQTQIYTNLELSNKESLSEQEDTDVIKALMELKAKEVAYEAALSAAAQTMKLSLVNFL